MIILAVVLVIALASVRIAHLKYATAIEGMAALDRIKELEEQLAKVDWQHFETMKEDLQAIHNMNSLGGRR